MAGTEAIAGTMTRYLWGRTGGAEGAFLELHWGTMAISTGVGVASENSPAMHSTAETMTAVSAIYRPTSRGLVQG